ncbi:hypothetical protein AB3M92_11605 [Micrococcus luteus]|uniref:hypothetical protein n=1 Tax=Micrococcus luteus TaxID=1270 RepID=UPI0039A32FB2
MTEQATPTTETPTVHWPGADEAEDTAWTDGWNEGYRRGYDTARASAPRRQAALEAFSTAWTTAARDDAQRPAFEALATAAHPLFEALCALNDTIEAEEEARMADPFD